MDSAAQASIWMLAQNHCNNRSVGESEKHGFRVMYCKRNRKANLCSDDVLALVDLEVELLELLRVEHDVRAVEGSGRRHSRTCSSLKG